MVLKANCVSLALLALVVFSSSLAACSGNGPGSGQYQQGGQNQGGGQYQGGQYQGGSSPYQQGATTPLAPAQGQGNPQAPQGVQSQNLQGQAPALYETEVQQAQANHAIKQMVTITTRVKRMLPEDRKGRAHEKFLLGLQDGSTVLVAHSIDSAPYVPVQPGDIVTIHGEYIWNAKGGLIHWTHHTDSPRHEGCWIDFNGQRYQ